VVEAVGEGADQPAVGVEVVGDATGTERHPPLLPGGRARVGEQDGLSYRRRRARRRFAPGQFAEARTNGSSGNDTPRRDRRTLVNGTRKLKRITRPPRPARAP
jgi:hypothetical protein